MSRHSVPSVLIVDDNMHNLQILGNILNQSGYETIAVQNGRQAIDFLSNEQVDCILLDIMMPGMDGYQICKEIRKNNNTCTIPIIFITAKSEIDDIVKGFDAGGIDYIVKPFNSAELLARVGTHVALKKIKDKERQDLLLAKQIQEKILPNNIGKIDGFNFVLHYLPTKDIGGDIYDVAEIKPGYIRIFLADATGHGVHGALVTMLIKSEYEKIKTEIHDISELMNFLNNQYIDSYKSLESFFSAIVVDIDSNNGVLHYTSAGHPCQFLFNSDRVVYLTNSGKIIGIAKNQSFPRKSYSYTEGDKLLLFTDGLFEQFNYKNEEFSEKRIENLLNSSMMIENNIHTILEELKRFTGDKPFNANDDITIIGVEPV